MAVRNDNSPDPQDDPEARVRKYVVDQLRDPQGDPSSLGLGAGGPAPQGDGTPTGPPIGLGGGGPSPRDTTPPDGPPALGLGGGGAAPRETGPTEPPIGLGAGGPAPGGPPTGPPVGLGAGGAAPRDHAPTPPTPPDQPPPTGGPPTPPTASGPPVTPGFREAVTALYQKYYQRNPTEAELQAHAGNPGGIDAVETMLKANGGNATPTGPAPAGSDPSSIIDALYAKYGIQDGGRGSGFADRAYWLEHPSEILNGRLEADLAGTGTDQPTGTPGTGPWQNSGRNQRGTTGSTGATKATAPTGYQVTSIGGGASAPSGASSDFTNQVRQILLERLRAAGQPIDENAAGIAGAVTAARDEATRQSATERTALAERMYAQGGGLNTNALTQQIQQSGERNAQAVGGLRALLIMREVDQRRQELSNLLQMATASGDAESARNIQIQIALLNKQVQEEGLNLDASKYQAYLNQNAALAGLRG